MGWNDLIGRQLGQYAIIEEIGRGGSSRVYRGHDAGQLRDVAIKVIPNDAEDRVGFVRRFEREVQAVAQLNHPNIVTVYDRGETDDLVFLVMQCVMGGTLRTRLGRALPTAESAAHVIQMAQALHHAHLRGIVHRDVKPSNMLIDLENPGHLLLTDFGIAKLQGARGLTKTGTTIGTPEYMAPEQAEGKEIDARADVYSLGCVLYETLSGRPPFVGSTPVSVLYQQVHSRPAYIRGFNPDVPRDLTRVVEMALAKRPEDRYPTAESLAQALMPFAEESFTLYPGFSAPISGALPPRTDRSAIAGHAGPDAPPPTSGALSRPWPPLAASQPAEGAWNGLGSEGLDAIFPDDNNAPPALRLRSSAVRPTHEPPSANPTIPLPAFRLPARPSEPLRNGMGPATGQFGYGGGSQQPGGSDVLPSADGAGYQELFPDSRWGNDGRDVFKLGTSADYGQQSAYQDHYRDQLAGDEPVTALRRALMETGQHRIVTEVWRPPEGALPEVPDTKRRRRSGHVPMRAGLALVAALVLSVAAWVGLSASGLGFTVSPHHVAKATVAPTATVQPTPTSTPQPTATATMSPQQLLDQQAAAQFRAVTLGTGPDGSCHASTTSFSAGGAVYVNLCASSNAASIPMTVAVKQNGQVVYYLVTNQYLAPGAPYWYARYGMAAGAYHIVVTVTINGKTATARDIPFTIG